MKTNKAKRKATLKQLEQEYRSNLPIVEALHDELPRQLYKLLDKEIISLSVPIECRVKQWEKIPEKLERESLNLQRITELNDLIGVRLVLLFKRDLPKVCILIESNFKKIKKYDTQERLKEDQFGYSSIHYVVELKDSWLAVPTFSQMGGFKIEFQVRTAAQHIWAAASHVLQYKQEESVPPPVRRAIYRVSALLETVDLEFERVLEQRENYRSSVDITEADIPLNVDLLEKILDSQLPPLNRTDREDYAELLTDLLDFGVDTSQKLRELLEAHLPQAIETDSKEAQKFIAEAMNLERRSPYIEDSLKLAEKGVFYTCVGLVRVTLEKKFGKEWKEYIERKYSGVPAT